MSSFSKRLSKGQKLQDDLISYLNENGIAYFVTGYEGLTSENNALQKIISNNTTTSIFVRHYPDVTLASSNDSYLLEVKNSTGIEKDAWDNYSKLANELNLKVIFYLKDRMIYALKNIVFKKAISYCAKSKMYIPVKDGIWKCPRLLPREKYNKYLESYNYRTSGCSFALIDFDKSQGYDREILKEIV